MSKAGFAYAQARLHARLESRLSEGDWRILAGSRNFGSCIDAASQTSAVHIVSRFDRTYSVHAVERVLREEWGEIVSNISVWLPKKWQKATIWMTVLPQLRRFEYSSKIDRPLRWLRLETENPEAATAILSEGERAHRKHTASKVWRDEWCSRLPNTRDRNKIDVALSPVFDRYLGNISPQANLISNTWKNLVEYLKNLFRKHSQTPVAIFAFIGLIALDFERLRGIFIDRMLFPEPSGIGEM